MPANETAPNKPLARDHFRIHKKQRLQVCECLGNGVPEVRRKTQRDLSSR